MSYPDDGYPDDWHLPPSSAPSQGAYNAEPSALVYAPGHGAGAIPINSESEPRQWSIRARSTSVTSHGKFLEDNEGTIWVLIGEIAMTSLSDMQQEMCRRFGSSYVAPHGLLKIGISKTFDRKQFPLNGLRHPPQGDTSGWYIWSGEQLLEDPGFFDSSHTLHLINRCPEIMKYLGLGLGWRFLVAPGQEDVWFDPVLLRV